MLRLALFHRATGAHVKLLLQADARILLQLPGVSNRRWAQSVTESGDGLASGKGVSDGHAEQGVEAYVRNSHPCGGW